MKIGSENMNELALVKTGPKRQWSFTKKVVKKWTKINHAQIKAVNPAAIKNNKNGKDTNTTINNNLP